MIKMHEGLCDRLKPATFEESAQLLEDTTTVFSFLNKHNTYQLYKTYESPAKSNLQTAVDAVMVYFTEIVQEISEKSTITEVLSRSAYVDEDALAKLKRIVPALVTAQTTRSSPSPSGTTSGRTRSSRRCATCCC